MLIQLTILDDTSQIFLRFKDYKFSCLSKTIKSLSLVKYCLDKICCLEKCNLKQENKTFYNVSKIKALKNNLLSNCSTTKVEKYDYPNECHF